MHWSVSHETTYRYSVPVVFAPHVIRLTPRPANLRVLSRRLDVDPSPATVFEESDAFGNLLVRASFDKRPSNVLRVLSAFEVETYPATSLVDLDLPLLPWPVATDDDLTAYRTTADVSDEVIAFSKSIAATGGAIPKTFVDLLCRTLHERIDRHIRLDGPAQTPRTTLATRRGACRDITVLFLAACRYLGMAGRFVSGYQGTSETPDRRHHLHGWPEIFIPGAGWQGWDPTYGVRVGEGHIALCAASEQAATMPIEGGFYFNGPSVTSTLDYSVELRALSA